MHISLRKCGKWHPLSYALICMNIFTHFKVVVCALAEQTSGGGFSLSRHQVIENMFWTRQTMFSTYTLCYAGILFGPACWFAKNSQSEGFGFEMDGTKNKCSFKKIIYWGQAPICSMSTQPGAWSNHTFALDFFLCPTYMGFDGTYYNMHSKCN